MSDAAAQELLARELQQQARWKPRPMFAAERLFTDMVREEFASESEQAERRRVALARMLRHAAAEVPWWQRQFERLGVTPQSLATPEGLARLPWLDKQTLIDRFADLHAQRLPAGETVAGIAKSTGTTGRAVTVTHTARSSGHCAVLRQRQARWFRFDPLALMATIQPARNLPRNTRGQRVAMGETMRREGWFGIEHLFETGANLGLAHFTPLPEQVRWLCEQAPDYLLSHSAHLEQIAVAAAGERQPPGLAGVVGIAQTMTSGMRATIERVLRTRVHLSYGLNEFGIVAGTCVEGGRYHVHAEHVVVEIVDDDGRPCRAGDSGHVLISGLSNTAMPLFRYDTGDRADALEGPCPCGRTLPSFARLHGRYRRIASLPAGTFEHLAALQLLLQTLPDELMRPLLSYQLYQRRDRGCELRLHSSGELAPAFEQRVREEWRAVDASTGLSLPLELRVGAQFMHGPGGKLDNFHSEFYPAPDETALPTGGHQP